MANIFAQPYYTGTPLGTLAFYTTGTLTLTTIYADSAATTPLPNPVTADANGRFPEIYLADGVTYRVIERNEAGTTLADVDPINPPLSLSSITAAGDGTFGGRVRAVTPGVGTAGGFVLRADSVGGLGYFEVQNNAGTVQFGNWRYDSAGIARWSGNVVTVGSLTVGTTLAAGASTFSGRALTSPVALTVAATTVVDTALSNCFTATLTTNITTLTINNATAGHSLSILFKQDGTGNRTIAWPATFRWAGGSAPTLSTAAGARDLLNAQFVDGVWIAALLKGAA